MKNHISLSLHHHHDDGAMLLFLLTTRLFQASDYPNIYVCGDIADVLEEKLAQVRDVAS